MLAYLRHVLQSNIHIFQVIVPTILMYLLIQIHSLLWNSKINLWYWSHVLYKILQSKETCNIPFIFKFIPLP